MTTVGLVGCGRWGENILRDLLRLGVRVRAVARSPASRARALLYISEADIVPSARDLGKVDGLVVATPTSTHAEVLGELLIEFSVPVFVEKPITGSSAEARKFRDVSGRIFVMDKWRYHPGVLEVRAWRERGTLGDLVGLRTLRHQDGNPHPDLPAVWTYLPHDLASVLEIVGRLPQTRYAVTVRAGAALTGVLADRTRGPWVVLDASTLEREKVRTLTAYFEKGRLELTTRGFESALFIRPDKGPESLFAYPRTEPLLSELEAFCRYLGDAGPAPRSSFEEALGQVVTIENLLSLAGTR